MNGFYWIFWALAAIVLYHSISTNEHRKNVSYWCSCVLLLVLFVAQDSGVGPDTQNYLKEFMYIGSGYSWKGLLEHRWEPGYVLLNKIIASFFDSSRVLLLFMGAIILVPFFVWYKKESPLPALSVLVYVALGYYGMALGIFRQMCALAILTFSYRFIKAQRLLPFALCVLLAALFHRTSVIFASVYFVYNLKINKKMLLMCGSVSILLGIMGKPILYCLNRFARIPASVSFSGGVMMFVVLWVFTLLCYFFIADCSTSKNTKVMFSMLLIAATTQPISFTFSLWSRIVQYFSIALTMLIPSLVDSVCFQTENNRFLQMLRRINLNFGCKIKCAYHTKLWKLAVSVFVCVILFLWLLSTLNGMNYILAAV